MMASGSYATERGGGIGRGRLREATYPRGGGADYHLDERQRQLLMRDGQDAVRRRVLARITVNALKRFTVGRGPSIKAKTGDPVFNTRKQALWKAWTRNNYDEARRLGYTGAREDWGCDVRGLSSFAALLRQMVGSCCTDGDVWPVMTATAADGAMGGGQIRMIEAERVVGPNGLAGIARFVPGEGGWIGGVRLDGMGRAVEFAAAEYASGLSMVRIGSMASERISLVDGAAMQVRNPLHEMINQTRGEPALAAMLPELDKLEEFDVSVLEAASTHAKLSAIATSPSPGSVFGSTLPGLTETDVDNTSATGSSSQEQRILEPGTLLELGSGSDVKFPPPVQPAAQYQEFVLLRWGVLAADLGVPLMVALMDPRWATYSGLRAVIALAQENFDLWRDELERFIHFVEMFKTAQWIREGLLTMPRTAAEAQADAMNDGGADAELDAAMAAEAEGNRSAEGMEWAVVSDVIWPPMPVLDPTKEVNAAVAAIAAGIKSRAEATLELTGRDAADVDRERREERKREKDYGLDKPWAIGQGVPVPADEPPDPVNGESDGTSGGDQGAGGAGAKKKSGGAGGRFARSNGTLNGVMGAGKH